MEHNPLGRTRRTLDHSLSHDDIGNQARYLLNNFIHDRIEEDQVTNVPEISLLQEPGTPTGPPLEHVREIGRALRCIGDELDHDDRIQELIRKINPDSAQKTFMNIAKETFADGVYNWGRVGTLFYFAYKMAIKAIDKIPLIRAVINWVIDFIVEFLADWIIDRGGWEAIVEYFGTPVNQVLGVFVTGFVISAGILAYKGLKGSV